MARYTAKDALRQRKWTTAAFGSWQLANDGARTNGGGIVGDIVVRRYVWVVRIDAGTGAVVVLVAGLLGIVVGIGSTIRVQR